MLTKIINMVLSNGFIKLNLTRLTVENLKIGPVGLLLLNNLKNEWFYNAVINKDVTVFLNEGNASETYSFAKSMCADTLPFGLAETVEERSVLAKITGYKDTIRRGNFSFDDLFLGDADRLAKCTFFLPPHNSVQFFHQWQRQRRIWWRKFSAGPGKYVLTDIKNGPEKTQSVSIVARYPWGDQLLETIIHNINDKNFNSLELEFKDGKSVAYAHTVTSKVNLVTMFMNTICDAYDEAYFQDNKRPLLRLHRKLAPYKISIAIAGGGSATVSELKDLALYLCKQLRTNHVSTLLLPSSFKHSLEKQYVEYDQLGVPYTLVLNEQTLVDGICQLRSRDTTLKEQVHVANLVTYVEQLFRNY